MILDFTGKETWKFGDLIRELKVMLYHPWISAWATENNGNFFLKE